MKLFVGAGALLLSIFAVFAYFAVDDGSDASNVDSVEFLTTDETLVPQPDEPVALAPLEPANLNAAPGLPVAADGSAVSPLARPGGEAISAPGTDATNESADADQLNANVTSADADPDPSSSVGAAPSTASAGSGTTSSGAGGSGTTGSGSGSTNRAGSPGTGSPASASPVSGSTDSVTDRPSASVFGPLRNAKPEFSRYRDVPSADLPMSALTTGGGGAPTPNSISGQFRMFCEYSHFAYDDPIVYPGQPGKSHLHMFFGNTEADANSTSDSLFNRGGGSCNGYELDRSGYWVPALMLGDTQTLVPTTILLYYKTNSPGSVQTFPKGLRVIAGASPNDPDGAKRYRWKCEDSIGRAAGTFEPINHGPFYDHIPDCRALGYETLGYIIDFPFCWDGKNLDSADHRSHMAFGCSASHPVVLPQLQYIVHFRAPASIDGVHLSSDRVECQTGAIKPCGQTLHGDFWNAWHEKTNETWINECSRKRVVCQVPNISAGTRLVGGYSFSGNPVLNLPAGSYVPGRD